MSEIQQSFNIFFVYTNRWQSCDLQRFIVVRFEMIGGVMRLISTKRSKRGGTPKPPHPNSFLIRLGFFVIVMTAVFPQTLSVSDFYFFLYFYSLQNN